MTPSFDIKAILDDMNAEIGKENRNKRTAGKECQHVITNDNGQRKSTLRQPRGVL